MLTAAPRLLRYPNGFEVLYVPSRAAPVVALELWVRVGSVHEREGEAGLSHLVEHMLFKGTAARPVGEIAREIEAVGGEINAYTSPDHTVYTVLLASRFARTGVEVLADALFCSSFDAEELEKEKGVVLEEIRRSRDLPHHALSQVLFSEAYGGHPYGRPVIGTEESVAAFTRADCLSFTRRWYHPGNMVLVLAGRADLGDLGPRLEALFGGRPAGRSPARMAARSAPRRPAAPPGFRSRFESRPLEDAYFDLAFPGPSAFDPDLPAVDALMAVLGQGEASRLQHRVKLDRNLVRSVGAGAYAPCGPGLLYVGGVADPARFAEAYGAICEETFRLCREPVGLRELERVKENLEADFVYQKETAQGQAQKAGFFHVVHGDVEAEARYVETVRRVTPDDVRAAARRHLRHERAFLATLAPAAVEASLPAAEAALALRRAAEPSPAPRRGRVRRTPVSALTLPNGARVLVRANPDVPLVAVRAAFLGGSLREEPSTAGAFHLLSSCLVRGTQSRDVFEIAHGADALGGQLDGFSGRNSFGLKAEFLSKYLEDGLDLFADVLCAPSFPADELAKVRDDTLGALRQRKDHPSSYSLRLFEEALYPGHPLGLDPLGTPESVRRLSRRELVRAFSAFARPEDLCVAVAGDVDPEAVHAFFSAALGHLEAGGALPPPPPAAAPPSEPVLVNARLPVEQAHVVVGFLGATLADADRSALRVANSVLSGQGGRLFRRLRDELGLAYSVGCSSVEGIDRGYVAAYIATAPDRADQARDGLLAEFARLAAGDLSRAEVEEAKRKLVGGFEISLQENAFQAAQLALDEVYGLGHAGLETYPASILGVTLDQVVQAARRIFVADRHVCATVSPGRRGRRRT